MPPTSLVPFNIWLRLIYWDFLHLLTELLFFFLSTALKQFLLISFYYFISFVRSLQNVETACSSWKWAPWDDNQTNCVKMLENRACQAAARSVISWTIAISHRLLWSTGSNWRPRATAKCNEWILKEAKAVASVNNWSLKGHGRDDFFFLSFPERDSRVLTHPNGTIFNKNLRMRKNLWGLSSVAPARAAAAAAVSWLKTSESCLRPSRFVSLVVTAFLRSQSGGQFSRVPTLLLLTRISVSPFGIVLLFSKPSGY